MRFRKRIKVFPGFHLNFSSSGISSTIGVRGASINFSKRGTYLNTSIPGTGFYNRQRIGGGSKKNKVVLSHEPKVYSNPSLAGEIKSVGIDQMGSSSLKELSDTLSEVYNDRNQLQEEITKTKRQLWFAQIVSVIACLFLVGFFIKSFKRAISEREEYLIDLEAQLKNSQLDIDMNFDEIFGQKYDLLIEKYKTLLFSQKIWDITSSVEQDRKVTRSAASHAITRVPVKFKFDNISIIRSSFPAIHFENKNGGDLFIYPAFVIITNNHRDFALVDLKDLQMEFLQQRFIEEEQIPSDTRIVGKTWAKVNKNGTPDKRFKDNYEIPVVRYGQINISSQTGLNEVYSISSCEATEDFVSAFKNYQKILHA